MSLRDTILASDDNKPFPVEVPEWGCTVFLKRLSLVERLRYSNLVTQAGENEHRLARLYARLLTGTVCDESGNKVFTDEDTDTLVSKNGRVLDRLCSRLLKEDEAIDTAKKD